MGLFLIKQTPDNYLLQNAHRLEKGLLYTDPRPLWGSKTALKMAKILADDKNTGAFYYKTAISVLYKYVQAKNNAKGEDDRLLGMRIEQMFSEKSIPFSDFGMGGIIHVSKEDILMSPDSAFIDVVNSRHSIRSFSDTPVTDEEITEAVRLALQAPSACNRQAFKVYVSDKSYNEICEGPVIASGNRFLIVTGVKDAYTLSEIADWVVSACIFCGYLTLSL